MGIDINYKGWSRARSCTKMEMSTMVSFKMAKWQAMVCIDLKTDHITKVNFRIISSKEGAS